MIEPQASAALVMQGFSSKVVPPSRISVGRDREIMRLELEPGLPLIVGEANGATEDQTGVGFHPEAEAGGLMTRLLDRVGVDRSRFNVTNVVWQRPPGNELYDPKGFPLPYTHEAIDYWKPFLHQAIEELQPSIIIGLGRTALETLTGFQDIGTTRGYVCQARIELAKPDGEWDLGDDPYERKDLHIPTICTYHPAFLNYGQRHLSGVFIRDVLAALEIAEKGLELTPLRITPCPSPDAFRWFCRQYNPEIHKLTVDIENPEKRAAASSEDELLEGKKEISYEIDRLSFCYAEEIGGFSVPFEEPFLSLAKELMASSGPKRGHNCRLHDFPRLKSHGFVINGREYDTLDGWRHLNRGLANHAGLAFIAPFYTVSAPWKHEAHSQPETYSALDAIHQHRIGDGIERDLRASGQWEVYERHVVDIISTNHGICTRMALNGLPIDPVKIDQFRKELEQTRQQRMDGYDDEQGLHHNGLQELVPELLKPVKQKKGLKRVPKNLTGYIQRTFAVLLEEATSEEIANAVGAVSDIVSWNGKNAPAVPPINKLLVERWALLQEFNPASHLQVKALIRHYGHKAKTDRKTKSETSGDDTLKSLITKYAESKRQSDVEAVEAYRLIRECRAIDKVLGTYVNGWKPASDGLIHATPGIWGDMFRISWRKPNLTATISDKKEIQIAAGFRKCICVADDELLVEADWKSQEAVLLAYYANDPDYMRLALLGLNAYMASHLLNRPADLSWSDADLGRYLYEIKHDKKHKKIYDDAKHTIYLVQNGGTPFLISEQYELPRARAQYLYNFYYDLFPKIRAFQQATLQKAHEKCGLVNPYGYKMPFWNIFAWQQKRFDRLRQLWVRYVTEPQGVFTKKDRELLDAVIAKGGEEAIASMCYDLGDDAKGALSFFPRDTGAAMLKDAMLAMEEEYQLASRGILRGCIHDATLSICKRREVDEVAEIMRSTMERPLSRLDGLVIPVDISVGQSWEKDTMVEWKAVEAHALLA